MKYKNVFKRYESKYLISEVQLSLLQEKMKKHMVPDKNGNSTICNIYLDTPDFLLIRRSIEKPLYKEKLRIRSYGVTNSNSTIFFELKKKFKSIVYKRRLDMKEQDVMDYIASKNYNDDTQILREINYCLKRYDDLKPRVFISYDREAFFDKDNPDFRMTFDKNILWRDYDLSLCHGIYGQPLLSDDMILMEIKSTGGIPLWLTAFLSEHGIYKVSFSKYGKAYKEILSNPLETDNRYIGGVQYAQ